MRKLTFPGFQKGIARNRKVNNRNYFWFKKVYLSSKRHWKKVRPDVTNDMVTAKKVTVDEKSTSSSGTVSSYTA
ncbi:hypothetical protein ACX0G7_08075 [Flavitalea antarctica]